MTAAEKRMEAREMHERRGERDVWVQRAWELLDREEEQMEVVVRLREELGITEAEAWYGVARARERLGWTLDAKKAGLVEGSIERAEQVRALALGVVEKDEGDRVGAIGQLRAADDQLNRLSGAYEPERIDFSESVHEVGADEAMAALRGELKRLGLKEYEEGDEEGGGR